MILREEAEMVARAQHDPLAFGELYELYFDPIYRYVHKQVGSHQETQDIVAETFFKALRGIHGYTFSGRPFLAWLYSIARNCTIDYYRRQRRELVGDDFAPWVATNWQEIEAEIERRAIIEHALSILTAEQQEVLRLHYLEDMKFKDIAAVTNRSEGAVKALALRALNRLRAVLVKEGEKDGF